ncbi:MAG TPA: DASS family sodium-coupled anion symporter [archaeon]|nr:DASS family sodium-coupled anion symporter [archaeon]
MGGVRLGRILTSIFIAIIAYIMPLGMTGQMHVMFAVLVLVAALWISEAAPLHATAILAALLMIQVVGLNAKDVFAQFFDQVIVLLLGGFVIAVAINKHGLDEYIAYKIIGKAGSSPKMIILALMGTATFISMWISNSATAAIIMPIALVVLYKNKLKFGSNFGKAAVLAVGYGATIGGMGTIIGSTPNVIAAKFLHDSGVQFGFYEWFYRGFPFMVVMMLIGWLVLITLFRPEKKEIKVIKKTGGMTREQKKVVAIFALTIALWVTESVHGIANGTVSLIPIILYYFTSILNTDDFAKVDWATLILLGGGLAVGYGIHATNLDQFFATLISGATGGQGVFSLFLLLGLFGVMLTMFISNTTAASVYLPIVVALASSFGANATNAVMIAALGVSMDFIFPVGTPPTAIAYGTKYVSTKDIALAGGIISVLGIIALASIGMLWQ